MFIVDTYFVKKLSFLVKYFWWKNVTKMWELKGSGSNRILKCKLCWFLCSILLFWFTYFLIFFSKMRLLQNRLALSGCLHSLESLSCWFLNVLYWIGLNLKYKICKLSQNIEVNTNCFVCSLHQYCKTCFKFLIKYFN